MLYFYKDRKTCFGPAQERYLRPPVDPFLGRRGCDWSSRCSHAESRLKLLTVDCLSKWVRKCWA